MPDSEEVVITPDPTVILDDKSQLLPVFFVLTSMVEVLNLGRILYFL